MQKKILISIIIVHYNVKAELKTSIHSIMNSKLKGAFEVMVVDNDEHKTLGKELSNQFPSVRYIAAENKGFSAGCNIGADIAKGELLFFLNPDTIIFSDTLEQLYNFAKKTKQIGAISPLLVRKNLLPYHQGEKLLTPLRGFVALSFLNKLFPENVISKEYLDNDADYTKDRQIDVVPGTALFIQKKVFMRVGKFDEKFFLYFEEFDLCKRLKESGYKNFIIPQAKVIHIGEQSTKNRNDINEIMSKSKFYYFRKHYGLFSALAISGFTAIGKVEILAFLLSILGVFLATYDIINRVVFIGDQGWFYLSARDMILAKHIPLVGIASSHPWLHQGALWTYLLGIALWIGKFHPLSGFYLSVFIGFLTSMSVFWVTKKFFGSYTAIVTTMLSVTSPALVANAQFAYHTTLIPFFVLWYMFGILHISKGNTAYLAMTCFFLGLLYQTELFSVIFVSMLGWVLVFAFKAKKVPGRNFLNKKIVITGIGSLCLSMLPIIIYDIQHGFPQTAGFALWIGYSLLKALHIMPSAASSTSFSEIGIFLITTIQSVVLYYSLNIALGLFICLFIFFIIKTMQTNDQKNFFVLCWFMLPIIGVVVTKTPSGAYLPFLYPALVIILGYSMVHIFKSKLLVGVIIGVIALFNCYSMLWQIPVDQHLEKFSLAKRIDVAKDIVTRAHGRAFSLRGEGPGAEFASFTMSYEYLVWWLGGDVVKTSSLEYVISENKGGIFIIESSPYARVVQ